MNLERRLRGVITVIRITRNHDAVPLFVTFRSVLIGDL